MTIDLNLKKFTAELIGTFVLAIVVFISLNSFFPIATPVLAGLTLGVFVYTIGKISGSHINPAVTIGLFTLKKISAVDTLIYLLAQVLGAGLALFIGSYFIDQPVVLDVVDSVPVFLAEALGAFIFTFGICAVVAGKVHENLSGIVVGGSLMIGLSIAAVASNAILNPAVAITLSSLNLSYLLGPIIGSIIGFSVYQYMFVKPIIKSKPTTKKPEPKKSKKK